MSSLRKHRKNKTFVITAIEQVVRATETTDGYFRTTKTVAVACTAPEALKGFLAFRETPVFPPTARECLPYAAVCDVCGTEPFCVAQNEISRPL